jgi:hypothetical protein
MSQMQSEDDLVRRIKTEFSPVFQLRDLQPKKDREREAWDLIQKNRGHYSEDVTREIFRVVDLDPYAPNKRWFGQLLNVPNVNRICRSSVENRSKWIDELLFSSESVEKRLMVCETSEFRPEEASKGVATLFLYLMEPERYNVWLPTTHQSLELLGRIQELEESNWSKNSPVFNAAAISFRDRHKWKPQEVDWALWMIEMINQNSPALDRYRS